MMRSLWSNLNIPREYQPRIFAVTGHIEEHYIKKAVTRVWTMFSLNHSKS